MARLLRLPGVRHATGLERSTTMLDQAARRNRKAIDAGRLRLMLGDFARLPLADGSMDAIMAVNVAYFMDGTTAVAEAFRVLRPGGCLVIYVTARSAMQAWPFAGPHSHRLFENADLKVMLAQGGFRKEAILISSVDAGFGVRGVLAKATK
jgi:SAM-dependent methyltransferase